MSKIYKLSLPSRVANPQLVETYCLFHIECSMFLFKR